MIDTGLKVRRSKRLRAHIMSIEKPNDKYGAEVFWYIDDPHLW